MEPKSIAFYTAVAVSILAVISATTFPSLALAQQQPDGGQSTTQAADDTNTVDENDSQANENANTDDGANTDSAKSNDESDEGGATDDNGAESQSIGLDPSNGVVSCGQVVMEDAVLGSDLNCDTQNALTVGADNVVIDLNGYKISSAVETDSSDLPTGYDGSSGILVTGADNVVITGLGGIEGFDAGVRFVGSSGGQVTDVDFTNNDVGIVMSGADETEISKNRMTQNGIAIVSTSSNEATIAFNSAIANELQGFVLSGSSDNIIAANTLYGNGDNGIYVDMTSTGNTFDFNTVFGSETADINNADGAPTSVNGNTYGEHNNCGISLPAGLCRA